LKQLLLSFQKKFYSSSGVIPEVHFFWTKGKSNSSPRTTIYIMCRGLSDKGSSVEPRPTLMAGSFSLSAAASVASSRLASRAATIHCRFSCSSHARRSLSLLNGGPCTSPSPLRPVDSTPAIVSLLSDEAVGACAPPGRRVGRGACGGFAPCGLDLGGAATCIHPLLAAAAAAAVSASEPAARAAAPARCGPGEPVALAIPW